MRKLGSIGWLRIACLLAVVGLALMMWSILDPRAPPVLIALSLGQGIGTLSLAIYARIVLRDFRALRKAARAQRESARLAEPSEHS